MATPAEVKTAAASTPKPKRGRKPRDPNAPPKPVHKIDYSALDNAIVRTQLAGGTAAEVIAAGRATDPLLSAQTVRSRVRLLVEKGVPGVQILARYKPSEPDVAALAEIARQMGVTAPAPAPAAAVDGGEVTATAV